jgi:hypothetical protein
MVQKNIQMPPKLSENYPEMFAPEHPHRRFHILLSILAFTMVFASVMLYKQNRMGEDMIMQTDLLTQDEMRSKKLEEMITSMEIQKPTSENIARLDKMMKSFNKK